MDCDGRSSVRACKKEAKGQCSFCKRQFCEEHLRPKLTGSRSHIGSLTDPYWIKRYQLDDGEDGHPDPEYTVYEFKKHEEEMAEYNANYSKFFGGTLSPEEEWEILTHSTKCNGPAPGSPCDHRPVHVCFKCKKAYCAYHADRTRERFPGRLDRHVCK